MTTIAAPAGLHSAGEPGWRTRFGWAVTDTLTITRRNLLVWMRVPAYLMFTVIQPVMFVLLFRFVFGGAIPVDVPGGYVNFLIPGIIAQTAAFATFGTAIALAQELKKGVIDRLRSMPMARSAVLAGRLVADTGPDAPSDDPDYRRGGVRSRFPERDRRRRFCRGPECGGCGQAVPVASLPARNGYQRRGCRCRRSG